MSCGRLVGQDEIRSKGISLPDIPKLGDVCGKPEQNTSIRAMNPNVESVLCEVHARFSDGVGTGALTG